MNGRTLWPDGRPFALFLSHDLDQVYDRGVYRTLADLNHLRRLLLGRENGRAGACVRRIGRSIFRPKPPAAQVERVREIEARHGWRSTWFFLEGRTAARYGARYEPEDRPIREIARRLLDAGCEIGVHGSYYDFNDPVGYARSASRLQAAFGTRPAGIRNHYLRLDVPRTWVAQASAGYVYDATFAFRDRVGFRDGKREPFTPADPTTGEPLGLVVLPLAVMDTTLFRYMRLDAAAAVQAVERLADEVEEAGGLLSLLWHNNFFDEPEYADWEETYRVVLERLAARRPFCGTGIEIVDAWKASGGERSGDK